MALSPTPGSALTLAATLLLTGCENLLPGGQQSPPPTVAVAIDTAPPAPPPSPPPPKPEEPRKVATGPEAEAAFRAMSQTLRGLVATEQGFYAENGTYSADLERLGFRPRGESRVEFVRADKDGWAGRATHPALPGRDCVTFAGPGPAPETRHFRRRGREGVVVCDTDAPPRTGARRAPPSPADSTPAGADTTSALDAVNPMVQMRVDLRKLATAQAAYFGTQGTYSRRVETLPLQYGWQRGVSVTLLNADPYSWAARATHEARPGKTCVVWFGSPLRRPATRAEQKVPERAGIPVCDD